MVGEIGAALGALKSAFDITKTLADIGDRVGLNEVAIKLQGQIIAAQQATLEAQERLRELEASVRTFEDWNAQKARYRLADYGAGTFAWELRPEYADGEPPHRACPKCFERRVRAILQFKNRTHAGQDLYVCSSCDAEIFFGAYKPEHYQRARSDFNVFDV